MSLESSLEISSQGLNTQTERLRIYANNIANIATPYYVRKIPVVAENSQRSFAELVGGFEHGVMQSGLNASPGGVVLEGVIGDPTPGKRIYEPGHPQADRDGFITMSNVNILTDMADATAASRLYEANIAVVGIVRTMANRAVEMGR